MGTVLTEQMLKTIPVNERDYNIFGTLVRFGVNVKYLVLKEKQQAVVGFQINNTDFVFFEVLNMSGEDVYQMLMEAGVKRSEKELSKDVKLIWYWKNDKTLCVHIVDNARGEDYFGINAKIIAKREV
ncbi:MAG TPA: hypothetical protein PK390_06130 [Fervidobacterium nodosum]|nr:hypothetical protein [Fervidobacterium nodosum]